jgi:hypothetical protein
MSTGLVQEIEDLLHSSPYNAVDIEPLVLRSTNGMTIDEAARVRIKILGILRQLEAIGDVQLDPSANFNLSTRMAGQFVNGPVYVKGTVQFERRFFKSEPKTAIHVAGSNNIVTTGNNNMVTAGHNSINSAGGDLSQSAGGEPPAAAANKGLKYWITENPLVAGLIAGVLALVLGTVILVKTGIIH